MATFVPSQIVEYLDERYPSIRQGVDLTGLDRSHAPAMLCLLEMVDGVPPHLLTLRGSAYAEFTEAREAIRFAVKTWNSFDKTLTLGPIAGRSQSHVLALLRKHLAALPDDAAEPGSPGLAFITDQDFREVLRRDVSSANRCFDAGDWKAATVVAGSVVEALLFWRLEKLEEDAPRDFARAKHVAVSIVQSLAADPERWGLFELAEVARAAKCISAETADACGLTRKFRNLIHPGRAARLAEACDRGTALSALAAVELVLRDLTRTSS